MMPAATLKLSVFRHHLDWYSQPSFGPYAAVIQIE